VKDSTRDISPENLAVTFSTLGVRCLHSVCNRSPQGLCLLRESRPLWGSAEWAGAIGGLAPAPLVFFSDFSQSYSNRSFRIVNRKFLYLMRIQQWSHN